MLTSTMACITCIILVNSKDASALDRRQILRLQAVPHRPPDYIQMNLHCLILQKATEFRPSPYEKLALIDMELHVANDVQPTQFRRFPRWLPYITNRPSLLRALGLADLCLQHSDQCHLWRNNVAIDEQETTPLHLADGDYFKIFIGEIDHPEVCLSDVESKRCKHITMDFRGQWVYPY